MTEARGTPLRTAQLPPGSTVAVGDIVRDGDGPLDFGRVTEILDDGHHGPIIAAYRQMGGNAGGLGVPKLMRLAHPPEVALEGLSEAEAREEYRMEAARRVTRRLNAQGGYR
jgi:hypothetical protein